MTNTEPEPIPPEQKRVIQAVVETFLGSGTWPPFGHIDHVLDQEGIEVASVLKEMPYGWFTPDNRTFAGVFYIQDDQRVEVTATALYRCGLESRVLDQLVRALKWATKARQDMPTPPPGEYVEPTWSFNDFLLGLQGPPGPPDMVTARLIFELMDHMPDTPRWAGPPEDPYEWRIQIPAKVRRYRPVESIDELVQEQENLWRELWNRSVQRMAPDTTEGRLHVNNDPRTIFIVHGHDEARKHPVARVLEKGTANQVTILDERPNAGLTIIEKLERHAETADFAVVLLTSDDIGRSERDSLEREQPRARQNVVFEFGFFVGRIGRDRVAILYEPGVEQPSDVAGLAYIGLDPAGAWRTRLLQELRGAGIEVDMDRFLD